MITLENMAHKEQICEKEISGKIENTKNVKAKKGKDYVGAKKLVPQIQKSQRHCPQHTKGRKAIPGELYGNTDASDGCHIIFMMY